MVKATIKGKREPMELEGDMILGTDRLLEELANKKKELQDAGKM